MQQIELEESKLGRLFGTDGVRGIANQELTPEMAFQLGRAATLLFGRESERPVLLIGRDTRQSGPMLEAALAAGICAAGGDAVLAGVVPTPAIAYLTKHIGAQAGVVISASHNPFGDNGIKFFAASGYKLPDAVEEQLEDLYFSNLNEAARPIGGQVGTITYRHDLIEEYVQYALSTVPVRLNGLKVVMDCANGAAYEIAPRLLKEMGAEVIVLHNEPTGININDHCGSTHLERLQAAVIKEGAHIGLANDGDADRCLAVDEKGEVIDGDYLLVLCAILLKQEGKLHDDTLVVTVMSNIGLHEAMKKSGIAVKVTPVGDRYVLEQMREAGYSLGGEQSGHIIFGEFATTGDGLITALQVLSALKEANQPMSQLKQVMTKYPQLLVNVRVQTKDGWEENKDIAKAIADGEVKLGDTGRILVRPSGTEPLIRVMAEGPSMELLDEVVHAIADVVRAAQGQG